MSKSTKTTVAAIAPVDTPAPTPAEKKVIFAFSWVANGHYESTTGGYSIKRLESGGWSLTQKKGAIIHKVGEIHKTIYDAIRAGKDAAGVEYALPEKMVAKAAMAPAEIVVSVPEDVSVAPAEVDLD